MTREEITNSRAYQVSKAALKYYNEHHQDKDIDLTDAFEAGFEYAKEVNGKELLYVAQKTADRTKKEVISKACEWLENNKHLHKVLSFGSLSTDWDKFIREFRKAMEL